MLKKAILVLIFIFCACCPPKIVPPPPPAPPIHSSIVWIDEPVRETLRKDWSDTDPDQLERKYCIAYAAELSDSGDSVFTVHAMVKATVRSATPGGVIGSCPKDENPGPPLFAHFSDVHIHPPTTCEHSQEQPFSNCVMGGLEAWECFPSTKDWAYLLGSGYKFALIQCSKEAVVPYFVNPYWRK